MPCCGRRRKDRNIDADHSEICFKPRGIRSDSLESVILYEDEMEAVRLADYESLYQQECADKMHISRTTFSRLVESARKKIADALLNNKMLEVKKREQDDTSL
ncbi:MAG: DUF134 domain-containing protein [Sulfurospirillaceae bacterium]|nr:DUF134 domain-containing protein [Sulfurospirillaceae bacterium]